MFPLLLENTIKTVEKIQRNEFTQYHYEVINSMQYNNQRLDFIDSNWSSVLLGAGEEKAVFCVCDHNNKVFAIEVIDEKHYLNGRLINGEYYFERRIYGLSGKKFKEESLIGLTFTGLVKVREYIYGYEYGRFQYRCEKKSITDLIITHILQVMLGNKFKYIKEHYKDVHDRNVMFDISNKGIPILYRDCKQELKLGRVRLKAIDVR